MQMGNSQAVIRTLSALRQWTLAARFAVLVRWLLALAFLPSGYKKLAGERFTTISIDHPIGSFFEAFFQAHEYYLFVGLAQVLAAALLLWPRTALLGAMLFLPIISNIVVITWSLQFQGTVLVAVALLLATLYLLLWDAHRLLPLFAPGLGVPPVAEPSRSLSLKHSAALTLVFGFAGLAVGITLAQQPGQQAGALLLVVGAALLPLCLAAAWETIAAAKATAKPRPAPSSASARSASAAGPGDEG